MERMMPEDIDPILYKEHEDRYLFISPFVFWRVLDIACGIGYGAKVLNTTSKIDEYIGRDIDEAAVTIAKESFSSENVDFGIGDITSLDEVDESFDVAISFETLEHLQKPSLAVDEILRVLKPDGLWCGSVPAIQFDEKCDATYGKNPYHITRFELKNLVECLEVRFKYVHVALNYLSVSSIFVNADSSGFQGIGAPRDDREFLGSYLFFASNSRKKIDQCMGMENQVRQIAGLVEYDELRVKPLRNAFLKSEDLVRDRTESFQRAEQMIIERDKLIEELTEQLQERSEQLQERSEQLQERSEQLGVSSEQLKECRAQLKDRSEQLEELINSMGILSKIDRRFYEFRKRNR